MNESELALKCGFMKCEGMILNDTEDFEWSCVAVLDVNGLVMILSGTGGCQGICKGTECQEGTNLMKSLSQGED